jgi:hypothetical protein
MEGVVIDQTRGSRAPKIKVLRTHCRWCGKKLPKERSRKMKFCDKHCMQKMWRFKIVVMSKPDEWRICALDGCNTFFPVWYKLGQHMKKKKCCCVDHSNKWSAVKRGEKVSKKARANKAKAPTPKKKVKLDRSIQCFKKEPFGKIRCRKYERCSFVECNGFEK